MTDPYRERVFSCPRDRTYKYFFGREATEPTWRRLVEAFGPPAKGACGILVLETTHFLMRAPAWGNPLTVLRKRGWTEADVQRLHGILCFPGDEQE